MNQPGTETAEDGGLPRFRHEIAHDVAISGRINFPGDARIDGRLKGEVHAEALLLVGEQACLEATVRARRLILRGTLRGNVRESGVVELKPGCRLIGNVEANALIVDEGARFDGRASIGTTRPESARHQKHA